MNKILRHFILFISLAVGVLNIHGQTSVSGVSSYSASSVADATYSKRTVVIVDSVFITKTRVDTVYLPSPSVSPGVSVSSGETVSNPGSLQSDTVRLSPAMIESMRKNREITGFERDIESTVFIPKGLWLAGVSFSYTQSNQDRYQFFVFEDINADTYSFKVTPMLAYAFKNDMAAGLKFSYTRALAKLANTDLVLDSESDMNIDHIYSLSHNYYATALFRNYFSLGTSRRFGFFNEVQLELGGGQSKLTKGVGNNLTGTYETNFSLDIGLVPGLIMFLSNWSAIEVNVGVLGFSYRNTWSQTDRIYHARRHSSSANFRINLLSITFGTTFYL